jgi:hypothetical protein
MRFIHKSPPPWSPIRSRSSRGGSGTSIDSSPPHKQKIISFWPLEAPLLARRDLAHNSASRSRSPHPREVTSSQLLILLRDFGPCAGLPQLPSVTQINDFA